MKTVKSTILILKFVLFSSVAHAQFNTIGDVRKPQLKSPQETTDVAPVDSIMGTNALSKSPSSDVPSFLIASLPLRTIRINSKYGMRYHPVMHKYIMHNGIDLQAHYENVFSMFPGEVIRVGQDNRSGKFVTVRTATYTISYCHLSSFVVTKGLYVNAGDVLGVSGSSGMSTGPHLHLTTKKDGKAFNPVILLELIQNIKSHDF